MTLFFFIFGQVVQSYIYIFLKIKTFTENVLFTCMSCAHKLIRELRTWINILWINILIQMVWLTVTVEMFSILVAET